MIRDLNYPFSQEEYTKIGQAIGLLDTLLLKLEHETSEGSKLIKELDGQTFESGIQAAFKFAIGIDLVDMVERTKEKIKSNNEQIARINTVREDTVNDPKLLLKIADFIDIIYQPNQE